MEKEDKFFTVFGEGGIRRYFGYSVCGIGTEERGLLVCVDLPSDCCVHSMVQ